MPITCHLNIQKILKMRSLVVFIPCDTVKKIFKYPQTGNTRFSLSSHYFWKWCFWSTVMVLQGS